LVEQPVEAWVPITTIPAIISQDLFDRVQRKLVQNKSFATRNNTTHQYLLRALVSCGVCQASCTARRLHTGHTYYVCAAKGHPIHTRKTEKCRSRFSPAQQLDDLVWRDLCEVVTHPTQIAHAIERAHGGHWLPQELQARRQQLRHTQTRLTQQIERLTEAYLGAVIPLAEYQRRRQDLEQKQQALASQEEQLTTQVDRQKQLAGVMSCVADFCRRVQTGLDTATFEQQRQLVELLIDRVIVANGDVEIRYVIPTSPSSEHVRFCHLRSDYPRDAQRVVIQAGPARGQDRWPGLTQRRRPCMRNGVDPLHIGCGRDALPNSSVDAPARRESIFAALLAALVQNHRLATLPA
jgi:site-specific DNA recombinase